MAQELMFSKIQEKIIGEQDTEKWFHLDVKFNLASKGAAPTCLLNLRVGARQTAVLFSFHLIIYSQISEAESSILQIWLK